jgi:hypothetical protein
MKKIFIIVILLLFVSLKVSSQQDSWKVWHGEDIKYSIYNDSIAIFDYYDCGRRKIVRVFRQTIKKNMLTLNDYKYTKSFYDFKILFQSPDTLILEPFNKYSSLGICDKNKLFFINKNSFKDEIFNFQIITYRKKDPKQIIYIDSTGLFVFDSESSLKDHTPLIYNLYIDNPDEITIYGNKKKDEPARMTEYHQDEGLWVGQLSFIQLIELKKILIDFEFEKLPMSQEDINDFKSDKTSLTISFNNKQKTIYRDPLNDFNHRLLNYFFYLIFSGKLENISEGTQDYFYYKRLIRQ